MEKVINQIYWLQTQQNCTLQFTVDDINNTFLLLQKPSQPFAQEFGKRAQRGSRVYNEAD